MRLLVLKIAAGTVATCLALGAVGCKKTADSLPPPPPQVVVAAVVQKDVPVYSEWVGTTEGFVNADIYPKISGYLLKQNYTDGDHVKAGQLLFQIDDRQYKAALDQALGELAEQQADNKKAQQDIARYKPLYEQQVVSRQDYDHVNQTAHAAAASVQAAEATVETAKLNYDWCQVTSPIDGIAGIAKTQVGNLVGNTSLLTTVSQLDPIKVEFPLSEREYLHFADRIKQHEETGTSTNEPELAMVLADGSVYKYPGHFYVANRQVNVQTGTIKMQGLFPESRFDPASRTLRENPLADRHAEGCAAGPTGRRDRDAGTIPGRSGGRRQQGYDRARHARKALGKPENHRVGRDAGRTRHHGGPAKGVRRNGSGAHARAAGARRRKSA